MWMKDSERLKLKLNKAQGTKDLLQHRNISVSVPSTKLSQNDGEEVQTRSKVRRERRIACEDSFSTSTWTKEGSTRSLRRIWAHSTTKQFHLNICSHQSLYAPPWCFPPTVASWDLNEVFRHEQKLFRDWKRRAVAYPPNETENNKRTAHIDVDIASLSSTSKKILESIEMVKAVWDIIV